MLTSRTSLAVQLKHFCENFELRLLLSGSGGVDTLAVCSRTEAFPKLSIFGIALQLISLNLAKRFYLEQTCNNLQSKMRVIYPKAKTWLWRQ